MRPRPGAEVAARVQRLALHARRQPEYPALLWPGGRLDYGDLPSVIDEQVERLRGSGCRVVGSSSVPAAWLALAAPAELSGAFIDYDDPRLAAAYA